MTAGPVAVLVEGLHPKAAQQLAHLLAVAVRDVSFELHPQALVFVRELRAWSLAAAQQEAAQVFRNTPVGVPALASTGVGEAPCADAIDVSEAARRTGLSTGLLRRHGRRGRLGARKVAGAWRFDARQVDELVASGGG